MSVSKVIHVAVGVIERLSSNGVREILISKRHDDVHQGGLWEFPGGKVEDGESLPEALARELDEELGLRVDSLDPDAMSPLIKISHDYGDKLVLLDVWVVKIFSNAPDNGVGKEGQHVRWVADSQLANFSFPEANVPIITACQLPDVYVVTPGYPSLGRARKEVTELLAKCSGMILFRQPALSREEYFSWVDALLDDFPELSRRIMLSAHFATESGLASSHSEIQIREQLDLFARYNGRIKGVHLPFFIANGLRSRVFESDMYVAVSCHSREELKHAEKIQADFVTLSPVRDTLSHPEAEPLGWSLFESWVKLAAIPVYALGGLELSDLSKAKGAGAQGIAGIRAWS